MCAVASGDNTLRSVLSMATPEASHLNCGRASVLGIVLSVLQLALATISQSVGPPVS